MNPTCAKGHKVRSPRKKIYHLVFVQLCSSKQNNSILHYFTLLCLAAFSASSFFSDRTLTWCNIPWRLKCNKEHTFKGQYPGWMCFNLWPGAYFNSLHYFAIKSKGHHKLWKKRHINQARKNKTERFKFEAKWQSWFLDKTKLNLIHELKQ